MLESYRWIRVFDVNHSKKLSNIERLVRIDISGTFIHISLKTVKFLKLVKDMQKNPHGFW